MTKKRLAIFDIDGTIFRSSLLIELVKTLIAEGVFPASMPREYERPFRAWLDRQGSYDDYIQVVVKAFEKHIAGVPYQTYAQAARKVVSYQKNHTYRYTRNLVGELVSKGYYVLAISHSPREVVNEFCRRLGFSKVYARLLEIDSKQRLTERVLYEKLINDKEKVLKRALQKERLTLQGSIGVGDTESDIPFLKMVHKPICFNPNKKLYDMARRRDWKIVVERKDVIYNL